MVISYLPAGAVNSSFLSLIAPQYSAPLRPGYAIHECITHCAETPQLYVMVDGDSANRIVETILADLGNEKFED